MTKLLKVKCEVYFDGYLPEADEDYDGFITIGILMAGLNFDKKGIGKTPIPLFVRAVCSAVRIYFFSLI